MTFVPAVPLGGPGGLAFLDRTMARQRAAFDAQPAARRDEAYFRARIGDVGTAEDLVSDRRLLRVALTAFGLEADLDNRAFLRRVLEDGTLNPQALSNRLADKRYRAFSAAFGFGDFAVPRNRIGGFADRILEQWKTRSFEIAVGRRDESLRLALNARRELADLAGREMAEGTRWLSLLGNPPLRAVFDGAFGLPTSFGALDLDRQVAVLRDRTRELTGQADLSVFADPRQVERLLQRYLLRAGGGPAAGAPGMAALALLQATARG